jgi:hypothetical protein
VQLKVTPVKVFVIHIEAQTEDGNVHRVSISNMYSSETLKVREAASTPLCAPHVAPPALPYPPKPTLLTNPCLLTLRSVPLPHPSASPTASS